MTSSSSFYFSYFLFSLLFFIPVDNRVRSSSSCLARPRCPARPRRTGTNARTRRFCRSRSCSCRRHSSSRLSVPGQRLRSLKQRKKRLPAHSYHSSLILKLTFLENAPNPKVSQFYSWKHHEKSQLDLWNMFSALPVIFFLLPHIEISTINETSHS